MVIDEKYMRRALQLARQGEGNVSPNPMVGAVVVCEGEIIGEGYHRKWGGPHAEVNAINSVVDKSKLSKSTIYVTLEPCSHYGKTPPCSKLIIDSNIPRVVVGSDDPFEKVSGQGIKMLRDAGVEVVAGVMKQECDELNKKFIYAHKNKMPYVLLKWAQSSDGFISDQNRQPVKFSNTLTSTFVHRQRSLYDAIMVGTGTVIADNPELTVRRWFGRNPKRITFDLHGNLPKNAKLSIDKETIVIREQFQMKTLLNELYETYGITSLMVEGGSRLLNSFLKEDIWNEIQVEISPIELYDGVEAPQINCENLICRQVRNNKILLKIR